MFAIGKQTFVHIKCYLGIGIQDVSMLLNRLINDYHE